MPGDEQWRRTLREAMTEQAMRQRRPQPDELIDYLEGRLGPEERERIEEAAALDPEVARELADLATFPDIEAAPGVEEPSEAHVAAAWERFRPRLAELRGEEEAPAPAARPTVRRPAQEPAPGSAPQPAPRPRHRGGFSWSFAQAAAAFFLFTTVGLLAYVVTSPRGPASPAPRANVAVEALSPQGEDGRRDGGGPEVVVPAASETLVLVLNVPSPREFPVYQLTLTSPRGEPLWVTDELRRFDDGTFRLEVPRGLLTSGPHGLEVVGLGAEGPVPVASYRPRIVLE